MQYHIGIDLMAVQRWELNMSQAVVFAFVAHAATWASRSADDPEYFNLSNGKLAKELSALSDKPDTMFRYVKQLEKKGLIHRQGIRSWQYLCLTEKGKSWNRKPDKHPVEAVEPDKHPVAAVDNSESNRTNIRPEPEEIPVAPVEPDEHPARTGQTSVVSVNQYHKKEKETREAPVDNSEELFFFSDLKSWGYFSTQDPSAEESRFGTQWVKNQHSREEVKAAIEIATEKLGKPCPPLSYVNGIIRNRQVASIDVGKSKPVKTNGPQQTESTDPLGENTADYEAAAARKLEQQVAEQKAKAAQSTEPDLGGPVPEKRADRLGSASGVDPEKVASVQEWFVAQGYPSEAVMGDEQRVRIEAWVELNVTPKLLREFLQRAVNQRKAKPLDPVRVINGPLVGELTARRNSQGSQSNQNTTEPMRAEA